MNYAEQIYKEKGLEGLKEAYNNSLKSMEQKLASEIGIIEYKYIPEGSEKLIEEWEKAAIEYGIILLDSNYYSNTDLTKEHLEEEGWGVERNVFDSKNNTYFYTKGDLRVFIYDGEIQIEDTSYSSEFPIYVYLGKIPTIEQWKTLKELLGI